jgi:hypothetical protein
MHQLLLLMVGDDVPAVSKAVAVIATLTATRAQLARKAFGLLVVAAGAANLLGLVVIAGGGQ